MAGEGRLERKDRRLSLLDQRRLGDAGHQRRGHGGRSGPLRVRSGARAAGSRSASRSRALPAESLSLTFLAGRVEGRAAPVFVDPVLREIKIPWPVRSPAGGRSASRTASSRPRPNSATRRSSGSGDLFAFRGGVKVGVDFADHIVTVEAPGLESISAGSRRRPGSTCRGHRRPDPGADRRRQETREFVSLVLAQPFGFGEIRGQGYADVRLNGRSASPSVCHQGHPVARRLRSLRRRVRRSGRRLCRRRLRRPLRRRRPGPQGPGQGQDLERRRRSRRQERGGRARPGSCPSSRSRSPSPAGPREISGWSRSPAASRSSRGRSPAPRSRATARRPPASPGASFGKKASCPSPSWPWTSTAAASKAACSSARSAANSISTPAARSSISRGSSRLRPGACPCPWPAGGSSAGTSSPGSSPSRT